MLYLQSVATTIWVGPTGILPLWIGSTTTPYVNHISFWSNTVRVYSLLQLKLLKYFHVHGPQLFDRPDTMALHWPVLTATQVWTNNGNGDTSTGSVRDPQRHQWIKADWLHMTPFCCFSFFVVFYCSFMILCVSIYNHLIYIYMYVFIYLVMLILFLLFRSSQAVLQNQEICESSGFWKDTLEVVQIIWPVHFWPQVISESRSSFWLQAQGRWGQGLWCILVSPIQTLSSRYKTLRMQDNSRTKAWEKERKKCCPNYSHT